MTLLVVACGKRGDPRPPVPLIPQATSDLVVTQRANRVILSWSYPSLTTSGRSLPGVRRIVVNRYSEELPPSSASAVPPLTPAQFAKLGTRIDSIEGLDLAKATAGARLMYEDSPPFRSASGRPVRLTYAVVTEGTSARSEQSNLTVIAPLDVAVAPSKLTATANGEGVALTWEAPKTAATNPQAQPVIVGYNIYRDDVEELKTPVNPQPVKDTTFTDVPSYGEHTYRVTAVAAAGPPRIESEPSPVATVVFKDLQPPPPPNGLTALLETSQVRLVWDPVDVPDLAGYKIYRIEGFGVTELKDLAGFLMTPKPYSQTNYVDPTVLKGISYRYEVTAVDKSGNESKPARTGWVLVPKSP